MSGGTKFTWKQRLKVVEMCLSGDYSYTEVAKKFNTSDSSLINWIRSYKNNGVDGLKESHTWRRYTPELKATNGGSTRMKAGRKTTSEERLEIALYAIEHGKNYSATAKKYNVSYQQVYNWVKKYLSKGENGLKDNRGKRIENRDKAELTDAEKAELKLKESED